MVEERLKACIRDVPDWPKKGIVFKDITTLLKDAEAELRTEWCYWRAVGAALRFPEYTDRLVR